MFFALIRLDLRTKHKVKAGYVFEPTLQSMLRLKESDLARTSDGQRTFRKTKKKTLEMM